MTTRKIVFLDRKTLGNDISLEAFDAYGDVTLYASTQANQTLERVKDADIVITNKVVINKDIMDASSIKLICVAATGMNNIDLDYAKEKGIVVNNVAGYSTNSVAQLTFSMALSFIQKLDYYKQYAKANWKDEDVFTNIDHPFVELNQKQWGIIGFGNIGRKVAEIATAFGCKVSYYSTSGKNTNQPYPSVDLLTLLKESDIISIHAPLNPQTLDLINQSNLSEIKKGALLLNLGRGGIVNEEDIATALNQGQDLYYGTDVVTKEPIEANSPLLKITKEERLLITPHIAWASYEARQTLLQGIEKNIKNFLK